jgi:hypothetical protein
MQSNTDTTLHADRGLGPGLAPAAAQPAPAATLQRPEDRSQEFVAVSGGRESESASTLLVAGYLVMWALLLGFVFLGWRRSQTMAARIESLEKALEKHDGQKAGDET